MIVVRGVKYVNPQYIVGVDPARPGEDETVVVRQWPAVFARQPEGGRVAERIAEMRYMRLAQFRVEGGFALFDNQNHSRIDPETARQSRERARGLLKSLLTPDQWAEFEQAGKVTERIERCEFTLRPSGMIEAKKPRLMGSVSEKWCVYPNPITQDNEWMPSEDSLIGQLLHLRAGPDQLRAKANVFPGAR